MKEFTVYSTWTMTGHQIVQAETEAEARKIAEDSLLPNGDFLSESFEITDIEETN